ncbi:uncharacterized protein BT62DRAFT_1071479 [Guyanagaster necrorhizus]|uniref:WHIM1 domain-containing protein n=1 Tax=Guyanagaster necrorhizus TaxID=856835 RepID=A0A9P8AXZ4_9AGAR|nr:uncharacterized protein BT62DRAFT_1071479 [Guyanagaster necrorhizus MCA 3950]KAG7452329.1 hypothetical protein BT62DRAFT_1071479 [Guyanagaster necrorhizus MCA 3950]
MPPSKPDFKDHICPPSNAIHPSDRWESLFVYSFICKFTNLQGKVDGLETPMDLENALLTQEPNLILSQVLSRFILNLRPQTRNVGIGQISSTVANVLAEFFKTSERTVFWNEDLQRNVDPLTGLEGGFFAASWDLKLNVLRQLVELQLVHSADIKAKLDRAWGVAPHKQKKKESDSSRPGAEDPFSQKRLQLLPIGQDADRKRYWIADDSPRIYVSTNPWKMSSTFETLASTREEYMAVIESLKASTPTPKKSPRVAVKRGEAQHSALISSLEERVPAIDAEIARAQRARRKMEQRLALYAQADLRETRTRRQTRKPDYVYHIQDLDSDNDADEYRYQEDDGYDEDEDFANDQDSDAKSSRKRHRFTNVEPRRSTRTSARSNGKREASADDPWGSWRGERRSTRLGAPADTQFDAGPPTKRARTADSTVSTNSGDLRISPVDPPLQTSKNGLGIKASGAAALKPTEVALEQIAGKKRSKYWVYAVEPSMLSVEPEDRAPTMNEMETNGKERNGNGNGDVSMSPSVNEMEDDSDYPKSMEGSLSPIESS